MEVVLALAALAITWVFMAWIRGLVLTGAVKGVAAGARAANRVYQARAAAQQAEGGDS